MKITVIVWLFLLLHTVNTIAWGPIAHYAIGRDIGFNALKSGNMNSPDAWPSRSGASITDWFCWSHAVQRTGSNWYGVPNVPRYVDDGREPGRIMHVLAKEKIKWSNDAEKRKALDTAIGFVGHNAMDRPVHWDYFLGGGSIDNWKVHHGEKEEWADYKIAHWKGRRTFDGKGKIQTLYGFNVQEAAFFIIASGCPKVIQVAQKVARKNRRMMDFEKNEEKNAWTRVNSIKEIEKLIEKMTEERQDELEDLAERNGWIDDDVQEYYKRSKTNAQSRINSLP